MATEGKRRWKGDVGDGGPSKKPAHSTATRTVRAPRNEFTSMFEHFRDQMDAHHDRREHVVKASRDITALSKKIIFSLQRVRCVHPELPKDVDREVQSRLSEISRLLMTIAPELQGINRGRYGRVLFGMEELIEALTFYHYVRFQSLCSFEDICDLVIQLCRQPQRGPSNDGEVLALFEASDDGDSHSKQPPLSTAPTVAPDENDYIMGVFDLSGEMMRFATTSAAMRGELASDENGSRTIAKDMQELGSFFDMLPQRHDKSWLIKLQTLRTSVKKVERLAYDLCVRGSEHPKGWIPDTTEPEIETAA